VIVSKSEIEKLSEDIRSIIDGSATDLRDNREGKLSILKNDIHSLASMLSERAAISEEERDAMNRAITDISHQIRTPLTSAMIMIDLIADASPEKREEFAENIKASLMRTEWLVSSLLKMAKLETGVAEFTKEEVSSGDLLAAALKPLSILLDIKNQSITISGDVTFLCDKRWTIEAVTNIVKNASEHSPDGGSISVSVGTDPICTWLSVKDCGHGISRDDLRTIWRRFESGGGKSGFGIGLPLALAIMEHQNGGIDVDGGEGSGATFTLKFYK
jgi:signal transduction histidine kinase